MYPAKSIDLTIGNRVRFDAQVFDITAGTHHASLFVLSAKYDSTDSPVFTLTQLIWETTPCNDTSWHSWETVVYTHTVRVYCDETLVYNHARTDSQEIWKLGDESPFFTIGAGYANGTWFSCCDMIFQNLEILTCDDGF